MNNDPAGTSGTSGTPVLPADLRLGPVHLRVSDLDRSVRFYERSLGLQVDSRVEDGATLSAGGEELLVLHEDRDARPAGRHAGLYHFALLYPSRRALARAVRLLAATGASISGASNHGISEAIYLPDPDGNGIELAADQPRERWGDLRDPTAIGPAPLDMADLLATVEGEEPATRADPELRVGHLHLHVGDVDEGLAFYRDLIGFELMTQFESAAFVAAGGYHHHLGFNTWRGQGVPAPPADAVGLERWTVLLDAGSLAGLRERLDDAGVELEERDDGLLVRDPWGAAALFTTPAAA